VNFQTIRGFVCVFKGFLVARRHGVVCYVLQRPFHTTSVCGREVGGRVFHLSSLPKSELAPKSAMKERSVVSVCSRWMVRGLIVILYAAQAGAGRQSLSFHEISSIDLARRDLGSVSSSGFNRTRFQDSKNFPHAHRFLEFGMYQYSGRELSAHIVVTISHYARLFYPQMIIGKFLAAVQPELRAQ
jgi:hypothetical protein